MPLGLILSLCDVITAKRVTGDSIAALGKDARRYCFGRPASYQRVRMVAVFLECENASVCLAPGGSLRSLGLNIFVEVPSSESISLFGNGGALIAQGMEMRVESSGTYLGLFPLSREVRLRDCRIEAAAAEAYGLARAIAGALDMDGVSVTASGEVGAALGS